MQPRRCQWRNPLPASYGYRVKGGRTFGFHALRTEYIDRVFKRLLQNPFSNLLSPLRLLPSQCAVCRSWPSEPVCAACLRRFTTEKPRCTGCAIALPTDLSLERRISHSLCMDCIKKPPTTDAVLAALDYAYPWSGLISRYKFGEHPAWAPFFAALLLHSPGVAKTLGHLQSTDLILPVPLSKQRLQTRGFNQAWELAWALARQSGSAARADSTLLLRVKNTRPQTELLRQERLANVKGAFLVDPLRVHALKNRRVILVDDVMTSGASLFTAAEALRSAGAAHITGLVLARTPF